MSSRPFDPIDDEPSDDEAARNLHDPLHALDDEDEVELKVETDGNDATEFTSELDESSEGRPGVGTPRPTNDPFPTSGPAPLEPIEEGPKPPPGSGGKWLRRVALAVVVIAVVGGGLYASGILPTTSDQPDVDIETPQAAKNTDPDGSQTTQPGSSSKANSVVPTVEELNAAASDSDQLKQLAPLWRQIDELSKKRDHAALTTLKQQIELQRDTGDLPARSKVDYQHMLNDINLELENAATDTNAASCDSAATESISVTTAFMPSPLTLIAMLMIGYADDAQSSEIEAEKLDAEGRQARKDGLYRRAYNNFSDAANLWIGINELNKAVVSVRNAASSNDAIPTRIHQERLSELQQKLDDAHARQSVTEFLRLHDLRSRIAKVLLNNTLSADRKMVLEAADREISEIDTRIAGAVTTQLKKDRLSLNGHLVLVAQAEAELSARHLTSITSQVTQLENAALATQRQAVQDAFARRLVERLNALPMPGVDPDQRQTDQELLLRYNGELDGAQLDQLKAVELAERVKSVRDIEARLVEWERTAETVRTKMTKTQLILVAYSRCTVGNFNHSASDHT